MGAAKTYWADSLVRAIERKEKRKEPKSPKYYANRKSYLKKKKRLKRSV